MSLGKQNYLNVETLTPPNPIREIQALWREKLKVCAKRIYFWNILDRENIA